MTSIEWLLSELEKVNYHPTEAMIMYANKMFEKQIIDAYERGDKYKTEISGEQYYQETFKKD